MIKVRRAKRTDVAGITDMVELFWKQFAEYKKQGDEVDGGYVAQIVVHLLDHGIAQVAYDDDKLIGILLMVIGGSPVNGDVKMASEICFYVDEDYRSKGVGKKLLKNGENIAKQLDCSYFIMAHIATFGAEVAEAMYGKHGFKATEVLYSKEI